MRLEILSAESLGTRGLCCRVQAGDRVVVIDPGVALGLLRYGLPPHPVQVAAGRITRRRIVAAIEGATDLVFSHFHGDHVPLVDANPYQLAVAQLPAAFRELRAWSLSPEGLPPVSQARARDLMALLGPRFEVAEGRVDGPLRFSQGVPHGGGEATAGNVMLTRIEAGTRAFVHASDIQLLDAATIDLIIDWAPDCVLAAGPPLYRRELDAAQRALAWENGLRLAANTDILILDHHLMRSLEGPAWLDRLSREAGRRIYCAADFMGRPRALLEARRRELYAAMPVRDGWHAAYARGEASTADFAPRDERVRRDAAPAGSTLLKIRGMRLALGDRPVLDGLDLELARGEIHGLLGANGSGKSTLAYALMGCEDYRNCTGEIVFDGRRIEHLPMHERARLGITLAWQEPARFEGLSVRDYLRTGRPDADVDTCLRRVGLDPDTYGDRHVDKTLSGGERKRVELAAVLAMRPRLAILDEPTAGIDLLSLDALIRVIEALKSAGSSVLLITHQAEVAAHADRASQLCGGRIVFQGSTAEVLARYRGRACVRCDGRTCDA